MNDIYKFYFTFFKIALKIIYIFGGKYLKIMRNLILTLIFAGSQLLCFSQQNNLIPNYVSSDTEYQQYKISKDGCLFEGITFTNQSQIDNFQSNYPGCNTIYGNVTISGDSINNLNGLSVISTISGTLVISATQLISFSGLDSITFLGGLYITSTNCNSLYGFGNVEHVLGVSLHEMPNLTSLAGFENLHNVNSSFTIQECNSLTNLSGLENLNSVDYSLNIEDNESLVSLTGLNNLQHVGILIISGNDSLTSLNGINLTDFSYLMGLSIVDNPMLSTCNEPFLCNFLTAPTGYVAIFNNDTGCNNPSEIANSCGFQIPCLPHGNYYFTSQNEIDAFQSTYPECIDLQGNVFISGADITDLSGLMGIRSVEGILSIENTENLINLHGLDSLQFVNGHLQIGQAGSGNLSLTSLEALNKLESVRFRLDIQSNPSIENLEGLSNLKHAGLLDIYHNEALTSLDGLMKLDSISHSMRIGANFELVDISALMSLRKVNEDIDISNNNSLESLRGLDSIQRGTLRYLDITDNQSLNECDIVSICNLLLAPNVYETIEGNGTGCSSEDEVLEQCQVGIKKHTIHDLVLYPNPANEFLKITLPVSVKTSEVKILSSSGQQLINETISGSDGWLNIKALSKGLYIVKINHESSIYLGKFIKL